MSYILDALRKSEQERGHGNIPDVQTVHSSGLNYRGETKTYWPYILVAAVILNLLAIVYFIANKQVPVEAEVVAQMPVSTVNEVTENSITTDTPEIPESLTTVVEDEPVGTEAKIIAATTPAETVEKEVTIKKKTPPANASTSRKDTSSNPVIVDFYDLPETIKQSLPTITISAHVYSTNPVQRSIVINNNFLEEGEYVLDGLVLYEITTDGAIFDYQGTLFSYGVVSGWQ